MGCGIINQPVKVRLWRNTSGFIVEFIVYYQKHINLVSEIKCEVPHGQNVYLPKFYFTEDLLFGAKRSYSCDSGYRKMSEEATCTQDGWSPKPLCAGIFCC